MTACPSCGQENPAGFRLCGMCGHPLAQAAPAREERKVVTVLFADLVGSTARAERLDPEDVRGILSPFYARLRAELERFGGTVEKFIGDAVMAVFGAPIAHEDDPERAVRAALAIRDWAVEDGSVRVRIAVHTGEALVALGARPVEGEGMLSGDVVNTAARLQSAAPVNGVLVGAQTYRATERAIDYREHEPVQAKGKAEPLPVWEAVQARSRFGVDLARTTGAPLVGREEELGLLVAALARARSERAPQLVTLVGVPGIGKSRLLGELFAAVDRGQTLVTWRQGRSLPYGEGVSYWALGEMVKAQSGILETDAAEDAAAKLGRAVGLLLPDPAEAQWVESHLRPLAGLTPGDATGDRHGEAFAAWRRLFEALAEERPLVLVFEDLHWADDGLLDFVDYLVDWLADVPALVVASARPELLVRRPTWGGGKQNAATVSLSPLSDEETAVLVHALVEQAVLPAELQSALLERAGGNPLYAEEFVRMVAERGGAAVEVPDSVQGIIAARLDALPSDDKALLQDAAVVGKVFWTGALAAAGDRDRFEVEERLHALERRELVRRERRSSVEGEREYAFRHVLVRDVAYGSLPRAERAARHARAAEWIESLGRPDDHADLLAHHYRATLELARAAGVEAAVPAGAAARALAAAGNRASALNAFTQAARLYDEALALGVDDEARPHVLLGLGSALHLAGDERRIDVLPEAADALLAAGDADAAAEAELLLADAWWFRGHRELAREHLARAQQLVQGRPPSPTHVRVLTQAARYAMLADENEDAIRDARRALELAGEIGFAAIRPLALNVLGTARANSGDRGGLADLERAIELALAANDPEAARGYNNLASTVSILGDSRRAEELWREGRDVAERLGNATVGRFIGANLMWVDFQNGSWNDALRAADGLIAECEAGAPHNMESNAHGIRARILLGRDDAEGALAAARRGVELARAVEDPQTLRPALATELGILAELGRTGEAASVARELLDGSTGQGLLEVAQAAKLLGSSDVFGLALPEPRDVPWDRAAVMILDGDVERAAEILEGAGDLERTARLRLQAASAALTAGLRREAQQHAERALAFYRSVGATRYVRQVEACLAEARGAVAS